MSEEKIMELIEKLDGISAFLFQQGVHYFLYQHLVYLGVCCLFGIGILMIGKYIENRIAEDERPIVVIAKWIFAGMFFVLGISANLSEIISPYGGYLTHLLGGK